MKCITHAGKKGRLPLAVFLAAIIGGSVTLMPEPQKPQEDVHAYAEAEVPEPKTYEPKFIEYDVPDGRTSFKSYMGFKSITNKRSEQYRLQEDCWTDADGLRRYEDDYVVALGTFYADHIGERFRITLDTGESFYAVIGDFKADRDTDENNQYTPTARCGKCVLEFVVDTKKLDRTARKMGDISYISGFCGNVEMIEKVK